MNDTDFNYGHGADEKYDPETPLLDCTGRVQCTKCGKFFGYHDTISQLQENQMLPESGEETQPSRGSGVPSGKNSNRFRPEDVPTERPVRIIAVKVEEKKKEFGGGTQVVVKVAVNGGTKFWYLDIKKNPNFVDLRGFFGADENDWVDKVVLCKAEADGFYGNQVIRTRLEKEEKKPKK